jgi:hypothetical protein
MNNVKDVKRGWRRPRAFQLPVWVALGLAGAGLVAAGQGATQTRSPVQGAARLDRDYPVQPVSFEAVHLIDRFWAPKIEITGRRRSRRLSINVRPQAASTISFARRRY